MKKFEDTSQAAEELVVQPIKSNDLLAIVPFQIMQGMENLTIKRRDREEGMNWIVKKLKGGKTSKSL